MVAKEKPRRPRRRRRTIAISTAVLGAILLVLIAVLRIWFHGEALGELVADQINKRIRGQVQIGSIEWDVADLPKAITGGHMDVTIHEIRVYGPIDDGCQSEPCERELILTAPIAKAKLDVHPAMLGRHDLNLTDIELHQGGNAIIKQVAEPYPIHEYDTHNINLATAFYPKHTPAFRAGISAGSSQVFNLKNYSVKDVDLTFDFSPKFVAEVKGARGQGTLRYDGSNPLARVLYYSLTPVAEKAIVKTGPSSTPGPTLVLTNINVARLAQIPDNWPRSNLPNGLEWEATATASTPNTSNPEDGAKLTVAGKLLRDWSSPFGGEYDIQLDLTSAGAFAEDLSQNNVTGDNLEAHLKVSGPVLGPRVKLTLQDIDYQVAADLEPPLKLHLDRATAAFDMATDSGVLTDTVATGAGGEIHLAAAVGLSPMRFDLGIDIVKPLDVGPYLPLSVRRLTGGLLQGSLHAVGDLQNQRLDKLDLTLGKAKVRGNAYRSEDKKIHAQDLVVSLGGTRLDNINGIIDTAAKEFQNVRFRLASNDTHTWLRRAGAPAMARTIRGSGRVSGPLANPHGTATITAGGVPVIDSVSTSLRYQDQMLTVNSATSKGLGGNLSADGKLSLRGAPRLIGVNAEGTGLDLANLTGENELIAGMLSVTGEASGPVKAPTATATATIEGLVLAGDNFEDTEITLTSDPDGSKSVAIELVRTAGGIFGAQAIIDKRGGLDGAMTVRGLSLQSLTALSGKAGPPIGGQVEADLQLNGTPSWPTAEGRIELSRGWFRDTFLGAATLDVERIDAGRMRVTGHLFQGRIEVDGFLQTYAPFHSDLTITLHRAELDLILPELADKHGARGWVSGEVRWVGALSSERLIEPKITAQLTEAVVIVDSEDSGGRPAPFRFSNKTPLSLHYDGTQLAITNNAVFTGPAGDFTLSGKGSREQLNFSFKGRIALETLAPYLLQYFESMTGAVGLAVTLTGTLEKPRVTGVMTVDNIAVKPLGQDATVLIPGGRIELQNDQLSVTGLSMQVNDEFSSEPSELHVAGGVHLSGLTPDRWALDISGELSGKMLLVLAPTVFSAASGSAELWISLGGEGKEPDIDGNIYFDAKSPLAVTPRGLRRELSFTAGGILFTDQLIELESVAGWIDDEGELTDISGAIDLVDWQPVDIDITISANEIPYKVPQTLEVAANLRNLRVVGGMHDGIDLIGAVEIVDGRYIRKFQPFLDALKPQRSSETSESVFETLPLLGNARLNLQVETRAFFVKNNVAEIEMNGQIGITGTPKDPRLSGIIRVEQGTFKFAAIRARFEHTQGTVDFSPFREFPTQTPTLDLRSESEYRDISGHVHNILLTLRGPISQLDWDLSTQAGLDKAQTFTLILAGRTPDETRAALGDEAIGSSTSNLSSSATTGSGAQGSLLVADQVLKQFAGEYFSLLIEDSIKNVTDLDVARLELGTQSIGFHVEKDLFPSLRAIGDFEKSLQGYSWDVHGEYRLNDTFSLEAGTQAKNFDDEALEDDSEGRGRLIWRKVLLP